MHKLETIAEKRDRLFAEHARRNAATMRREFWETKSARYAKPFVPYIVR